MTEQTGFIYKLYHTANPDYFYIGSTVQRLINRLQWHKLDAKRGSDRKICQYLREHKYTGFRIVLIDQTEFTHKSQLRELEDQYIRELEPPLNMIHAAANPADKLEYDRTYYAQNKEKISAVKQAYREANKNKYVCELCSFSSCTVTKYNIHLRSNKHKEAVQEAQDNGDEVIEEDNKEQEQQEEKNTYYCELCNYSAGDSWKLTRHNNSQAHKNKAEQQAEHKQAYRAPILRAMFRKP